MPLVLKMAIPQQRSWCVVQLAKKGSNHVSTYAWYKKSEQIGCICKDKSLYPFCLNSCLQTLSLITAEHTISFVVE
jgi:hypothetical protein